MWFLWRVGFFSPQSFIGIVKWDFENMNSHLKVSKVIFLSWFQIALFQSASRRLGEYQEVILLM